jgi:hypothetical protein
MRCSKCRKVTPAAGFATFRTRTGEIRRRGICQGCRGEYATENFERLQDYRKNYNAAHRTEKREKDHQRRMEIKKYVDDYKATHPCMDCGKQWPPVAMDLDHVKGENRTVSRMVSSAYKLELVIEELKLCEPVCACCHRIRTAARKQNLAPRKAS